MSAYISEANTVIWCVLESARGWDAISKVSVLQMNVIAYVSVTQR